MIKQKPKAGIYIVSNVLGIVPACFLATVLTMILNMLLVNLLDLRLKFLSLYPVRFEDQVTSTIFRFVLALLLINVSVYIFTREKRPVQAGQTDTRQADQMTRTQEGVNQQNDKEASTVSAFKVAYGIFLSILVLIGILVLYFLAHLH